MKKLIDIVFLVPKLGYWNVSYMLWYRFSLFTGIRKLFFRTRIFYVKKDDLIFQECEKDETYPSEWAEKQINKADSIVNGNLHYFFSDKKKVGSPPKWLSNPFNKTDLGVT